jgi:cytochrome c nitrite reductase small subunit
MQAGRRSVILAGATFGLALGVGAYTFLYARGASYMTNDPSACANCHVMQGNYDAWLKSSHRNVATCNDCHTPPGLIPKYMTKAENGMRHSFAFTTGRFHEPIQIIPADAAVAEKACRKCHAEITQAIEAHQPGKENQTSCIRCHKSVGHME